MKVGLENHTKVEISQAQRNGLKLWRVKAYCDKDKSNSTGHIAQSLSKDLVIKLIEKKVGECNER